MPSIVLHCPNCQKAYQMSPEQIAKYAGRTITCRNCKQPFGFDAAMNAAAQAAGDAEAAQDEQMTPAVGAAVESEDHGDVVPPPAAAPPRFAPPAPAPAFARPPFSTPPVAPNYPAAFPQSPSYPPPPAAPAGFAPSAPPAPPTSPAPPVGYASRPAGVGFSVGDLFSFRRMALPPILPLVFWLGIAWCVYSGLGTLSHLLFVYRANYGYGYSPQLQIQFEGLFARDFSIWGLTTLLEGLFWLVLGPLFWRGFCELLLAASRLVDSGPRR